jgi:NAD(P)H-dependent flavin oxidoreductase YrpB (nitropropane dioxygenase family)
MRRMHRFHIPVMGIGFTLDSALRVARFGIGTVISLADDRVIERVRQHYCGVYGMPYERISSKDPDARARRITAWLDLVSDVVEKHEVTAAERARYQRLLPGATSFPRGAVDVNIMTKVDAARPGGPEFSLAKAALRGFAESRLRGRVVLSAGVNPSLFGYLAELPFEGKGVVLKVSDVRSALTQGKFLAKKGIEIDEFRIESGLNCGGHVFPTEGELMGPILAEFQRTDFAAVFEPLLGRPLKQARIPVTAQGGVGNHGEMRRLLEHYGCDSVGWGTPFLLVPEVVVMDDPTRAQLAAAEEDDLYVSDASPLGVKFNTLRGSSAEVWSSQRQGSACPNKLLAMNTEFGPEPLCTASAEYQAKKLAQLGSLPPDIRSKQCICDQLGNSALLGLGISKTELPVAVCPGPNLAYFDRTYTLEEMVDHIYGRRESLVPADRPHMFAKELQLYVEHCLSLSGKKFDTFRAQLLEGIAHYRQLTAAYPGENLASLHDACDDAEKNLGTQYVFPVTPQARAVGA